MTTRLLTRTVGIIGLSTTVAALGTGVARAGTPVGTCTDSYTLMSYAQLAFDPDAQAIFNVVDANHDGYICFKLYPNGPHDAHLGNLVDDKAAPHS